MTQAPEITAPLAQDGPVPDDRALAWRWIKAAAVVITLWVSYQLLLVVQSVLGSILSVALFAVFGIIVALVAAPPVAALERYLHLPRTLASVVVLIGGVSILSLVGYLIAGPLATEARALYENQLPRLLTDASDTLASLQNQLALHGINVGTGGLSGSATTEITGRLENVLVSGITGTLAAIVDTLIVLVVAFWVLRDGEELRTGLIALIPGRARSELDFAFDAFSVVSGGYVRAQLLMALIIGVFAGVGCAILGVPFPLVVGIAAAIFELIPIVGSFLGGAVALLLAATVSGWLVVATALLFVGVHVLEAYVVAPRIQARFVQLHPLVALLALLAGIESAGLIGAFFAVPAASLVAVFIRAAVGDWRAQRPDLFAGRSEDHFLERRRRRLLREFRLFKRTPP